MSDCAPIIHRLCPCAPSPLEGEGRVVGWFFGSLTDPHSQSLASRGREAMDPPMAQRDCEAGLS
ncbi:MAG: hypothetical protein BGO80_14525 [Devosia sp. 63-57]|nr:MAG: hypothetical protein BGO80_14525 [Devosia sp. 63-57]